MWQREACRNLAGPVWRVAVSGAPPPLSVTMDTVAVPAVINEGGGGRIHQQKSLYSPYTSKIKSGVYFL